LGFNDPYVAERMLAACYGVAMSQWAVPQRSKFKKAFGSMAVHLYRLMFAPGARHATHHVLRRDYAAGFIELAINVHPNRLSAAEREYLRAPFAHIASVFPSPDKLTDEQCADGKSTIHMDFENYTIGRLVSDRRNYDAEHPTYKEIVRQIQWRIGNLRYR